MNDLNVGNALPLKPRPPLAGPCPDCDEPTRWNWKDTSHGDIQEYPGRYVCSVCGNLREAEYAHRWKAEDIAKRMMIGAPLVGDREWGGPGMYVLAAPEGYGGHFQATGRELQVAKSTVCRNDWNFTEVVPLRAPHYGVDAVYAVEELLLAAPGVLVLDEADQFRHSTLQRVLRAWANMHSAARPDVLMRFHTWPRPMLRKALEGVCKVADERLMRPLSCFLAAEWSEVNR